MAQKPAAAALIVWATAAGPALAASCPNPALPPGQEKAIAAMVQPGPAGQKIGLRAGDVAILRDRIAATWLGSGGEPYVYVVSLSPAKGPRAGAMYAQAAFPCWAHGPLPPELLAQWHGAADLAAAATAACPPAMAEVDAAFQEAMTAAGDSVRWRCGEDLPAEGRMPVPTLGQRLREVDDRVRAGDRAGAEKLLGQMAATVVPESLDSVALFDYGLALARYGKAKTAAAVLRRALQDWQPAWNLALDPTASQPDPLLFLQAERAAAAHVVLNEPDQGLALLKACWDRFTDRGAGTSCTALALADVLEQAKRPELAEKWLDEQLLRRSPPAIEWFKARIGLASRRDDARAELKTAEAAAAAYPEVLELQDSLATACFRAGLHLRAVRLLEGVYRKKPNFPGVLGRLSGVVNDWGRVDPKREGQASGWQTLRDEMRDRAAKDPEDTVAQFLYGVSLFYDAKFEDALRQMQKVEPKAPNEGRVFIYQAMAHLWLGHLELAKPLADKAVVANPLDPDVYYCQSQVLRQTDMPGAVRALERYLALETAPGSLHFAKKTKRVEQELALLRQGKMPPLWDKPGHYDDEDEPDLPKPATATVGMHPRGEPIDRTKMWLIIGLGAAIFIGGGTWLTRKKK